MEKGTKLTAKDFRKAFEAMPSAFSKEGLEDYQDREKYMKNEIKRICDKYSVPYPDAQESPTTKSGYKGDLS